MKRRDFLIGGMGALAAGATGCAGISPLISPNWPNVTSEEMDGFLIELDGAMNRVTHNPEGGRFIRELQPRTPSDREARLFRQGMRSLLLVGNFGDLSLAGQVHPGVQKRLHYSAPEMDSAVLGSMEQMKSLSLTARADMKSALRQDPELGERVIEAIDLEAASVGVPVRRRLQLRVMGKHIVSRLKHSSDMFIDEYVTKCQKVASRPGSVAEMQRLMATRIGEAAFKARLQESENAAKRWQAMELQEIPIGYQLLEKEAEAREDAGKETSDGWYRTGLRMLGIGAVTTAVGWVLIGIAGDKDEWGEDGLITLGVVQGVTVGPIILMLSLITLLIGGIIDIFD